MKLDFLHISECPTGLNSGMGRIQYNWNKEIESRGHHLQVIEPQKIGKMHHPMFFAIKAKTYFKNLSIKPDAIICHEPASGAFVKKGAPVFLVSHGIEARYWELSLQGKIPNPNVMSLKTRLLFPLWRLAGCNKGLKYAHKLLLSNEEDANYAQIKFGRKASDIKVFRNGYYPESIPELKHFNSKIPTILWNASWLDRKGKDILIVALTKLVENGISFKCILAGTGYDESKVMSEIDPKLKPFITVISKFTSDEEKSLLTNSDIFVLPSYFEGLPLSLVQAMASGLCCVVSDNCGQRDIVQDNINGLKFNTGNANQLAFQLEKVILDNTLRTRLSSSGQISILNCDWNTVSREVIDFVESNIA
ncbi:MAG: glycosyltransferase family 4 protein [Opitutaceae bacterium]|nr:glycosyltransferase family 4 protein [Cytophagales bacterium]